MHYPKEIHFFEYLNTHCILSRLTFYADVVVFLIITFKGSITSIWWIGRVRSNSSLALTTFQSSFLNYSQVISKEKFKILTYIHLSFSPNTIMYRECASSFQVFSENLKNKISLPGSTIMVTADWMRNFSSWVFMEKNNDNLLLDFLQFVPQPRIKNTRIRFSVMMMNRMHDFWV